jgi:hypothetical protein
MVVMATADGRMAIKMTRAAYERAKELSALVAQHGWSSVGVERTDLPTMSAILEEAINSLAARAKGKKR